MARPAHGDDRHAHRKRLAGRDTARIGKGVERNVHIPVLREMIRAESAQLHALRGNPAARESLHRDLPPLGAAEEFAL